MEYVHNTILEAEESMRQIKMSLLKRFKHGVSSEVIELTNRQLDGVKLSREALNRLLPVSRTAAGECAECGRGLDKIYAAAEAPMYCCPYCGQALEMEAEKNA